MYLFVGVWASAWVEIFFAFAAFGFRALTFASLCKDLQTACWLTRRHWQFYFGFGCSFFNCFRCFCCCYAFFSPLVWNLPPMRHDRRQNWIIDNQATATATVCRFRYSSFTCLHSQSAFSLLAWYFCCCCFFFDFLFLFLIVVLVFIVGYWMSVSVVCCGTQANKVAQQRQQQEPQQQKLIKL